MIDLDKLKALAESATPGQWSVLPDGLGSAVHIPTEPDGATLTYRDNNQAVYDDCDSPGCDCNGSTAYDSDVVCAFIAAANPQTVLRLIEALEVAQSALALANTAEKRCDAQARIDAILAGTEGGE